eukprot:SAG31_NODE_362_length_16904_cov_7.893218_5_plen_226_part_00
MRVAQIVQRNFRRTAKVRDWPVGTPKFRSLSTTQLGHFGHSGKLVIVTGGANGLGKSITLEFARGGANVICADTDTQAGAETESESAGMKGSVKFVEADFSCPEVPAQVVGAAQEWQCGAPVSVLVNNVGIQKDNGTPAHLLEEDIWDLVMNVNLKSYYLMAKHAIPSMLEAGNGVIINMASVQGHQSQVGIPAYAASKGGILSLTRQLAMDCTLPLLDQPCFCQ